ncbi:cytochrome c biogenesis protein CcdA [Robiginitalea sp. M39]|uniref:Cytochrome c biogenesis protein CcdA n=2 Tax=Robiginitalea aurantiaca TaxID=3056915 RepID=A0ABT7WGU0_9FLAO|nr:cytochrome c biogenesis protein CcdA [Robiginitalea aurantiaca]MDM9632135.1 cytochrome c biogenesis protein CcdA [Robiginitalea aurantiaca]
MVFLCTVCLWQPVHAQIEAHPVQWTQELIRESDTSFSLVFEASIDPEWHLYSQHTPEGGALPTEFSFKGNGMGYQTLGPVQESETETAFSDIFEVDETFFKGTARFVQKIYLNDKSLPGIQVDIFYQVCKEVCIGAEKTFLFSLTDQPFVPESPELDAESLTKSDALRLDLKNTAFLEQHNATGTGKGKGIWVIFGLGFLGGLLALLTPCVFPMIPLTVSFFTKQTNSRSKGIARAGFYGFCIILIYFLLSLPFHFFDSVDAQILNTLATNIWLNLLFFVVFVVFAFSFFGYYELTLPASWASGADRASDRIGGAIGIFFMALTLAIVSFSCTGPILGGLLGSTALSEGDVATNLTAGMLGFGVALALPFTLFAMFPSWLQRLPSSGGWMETVKVVLGFLELGLALKFLSNADLIGNWGFLKREVFLGIWILLALLLSAYLLGAFRFKEGGTVKRRRSKTAVVGALFFIGFAAYLGYGLLTGAPLKALSGFPPPDFYTLSKQETDCPLGLDCYKDFQEGMAQAQASGKPILLDFTGWACVNCRKMEEQVWSNPEVFRLIRDEYILVSLYVDERKPLPEDQQFTFSYANGTLKEIESIGDYWSTFQNLNFGAVSQPYYVLLAPDLKILAPPVQNTDIETYRAWLHSGLKAFQTNDFEVPDAFSLPQ